MAALFINEVLPSPASLVKYTTELSSGVFSSNVDNN